MTENRVLNLSSGEGEVFRFPLSFAQQRLWFLHRLEPDSTYNLPLILRLRGKLDVGSLERALSEIVVRHESLRTTFAAEEGTPYQLVHPPRAERLKVVDISEEADTEAAIERLVTEQALLPFDLAVAPRRAVLLRVEPEEHVLVLTFHHIVCDGWSLSVLSRELVAFYIEFSGGSAARLPELPIQYADYAVRQQEWLQGDVLEEQLDYWRTQLEGAPTATRPPDRSPAATRTELKRGASGDDSGTCTARAIEGAQPRRGRDTVHDAARCIRRSPCPLLPVSPMCSWAVRSRIGSKWSWRT